MYVYPFGLQVKPQFSNFLSIENILLDHEVDKIVNYWDEDSSIKSTLAGDKKYDDELRQSSVIFLKPDDKKKWVYERLATICQKCNYQSFHFDIQGFYQELQLTRYSKDDFFDWHMDFGNNEISHRKISITIQLSSPDEYEGGELQFMINQKVVNAPRKKGTAIIFPSFILHRVTPITKGIRHSIVGWVSGIPYR